MATITNKQEFETWLRGRPRAVAEVLAARAALRVLPLLGDGLDVTKLRGRSGRVFILPAFRLMAVRWAVAKYPRQGAILRYAARAVYGLGSDIPLASRLAFGVVARSVREAPDHIGAATEIAQATARAAAEADAREYGINPDNFSVAVDASFPARVAPIWLAMEADAHGVEVGRTPNWLITAPLWQDVRRVEVIPSILGDAWDQLKSSLLAANADWDVWTDWYEARLAGKRPRWKDVEIFRVTLNEESDWQKGPAHVNALIKAKIAEKTREAKHKGDREQRQANAKPRAAGSSAAALANKAAILLQSSAIERLIDGRLVDLGDPNRLNDPDRIEEVKTLAGWKTQCAALTRAIAKLDETSGHATARSAIGSFHASLRDTIDKHGGDIMHKGMLGSIFMLMTVVCTLCGVAEIGSIISGVLVGGYEVADVLKVYFGHRAIVPGKVNNKSKARKKPRLSVDVQNI